ncbi:MAG TPA: protease modulator HflC [Isosphaeraceae bacterium]|jgi:membrane protease subunit HflC|nr:protease modulator HflC [Isosphaeraceae bacterium]
MRRLRKFVAILVALLPLAIAAARSWVSVDESKYVLVTDFGRQAAVYGPGEAGFHLKWPWQEATAIDRRLRVFDAPAREVMTGDKRNLEVAGYVVWRVAEPVRFLRGAGTVASAEARLGERVAAALSNAIGARPLEALATTDRNVWELDALTRAVRDEVAGHARDELGVEVVDVRLRRFNYPVEVRPAVFDLIRSERRQVAATLRAEGEAKYKALTSQADRERDAVLAEADAQAERIRGKGEAEATRLLNAAHARDPKFFEFVRTLETYRAILDGKATVVLSASSPLLKLLTHGPSEDVLKERGPSAAPTPDKVAAEERP